MDGIGTNRLEAFSDGVIAVIITIMVLELKIPRDATLVSLRGVLPQFLSYLLSFLVVAIMWVNHHITCCTPRAAPMRVCSGRTTFSCSGCRSFPSLPLSWATIRAIPAP